MQRIRDEAHRFAITSHRARRSIKSLKSVFDDIPGIGPKRKKSLMFHYGSLQNIKNTEYYLCISSLNHKRLRELIEIADSITLIKYKYEN